MRFGGRRESDNVESQSGGGGGFGLGGGGGGGASMLFGLVFSRFGIGGVLVLFLIMYFIGGSPLGLTGGDQPAGTQSPAASGASVCESDPARRFSCQVLASTED